MIRSKIAAPFAATVCLSFILSLGLACASTTEEPAPPPPPPPPVAKTPPPPPPPPPPEPEPVTVSEPVMLPKTASALPALGLTGLGALGLAGGLRLARRRL